MPGPSWQDVERRGAPARPAAAAPAPGAGPFSPRFSQEDPHSPLGRLLTQREQLEQKMQQLIGTAPPDPRTAALYQVRPMAERRAEHDAWQADRERLAQRVAGEAAARRGGTPEPPLRERQTLPASSDPEPPLRPTPGEQLRRRQPGTPEDSGGFMALREQLSGLRRGLADADRQLAEQGMERERRELADMQREMGLDRLATGSERLDEVVERGSSIADRPARAGELIEQDWLARRDRIGGPDLATYERGFKERAARLFGVDTGTIEQLEERMVRQRDAALERRSGAREDERRDESRRDRALERRREERAEERRDEARRERALEQRREAQA